jgi:hypothetical protein
MLRPIQKQSSNSLAIRRQPKANFRGVKLRQLSAEEICQVNLVTFRESFNHRRWPRDVVEKFLTVEV